MQVTIKRVKNEIYEIKLFGASGILMSGVVGHWSNIEKFLARYKQDYPNLTVRCVELDIPKDLLYHKGRKIIAQKGSLQRIK